MRYVFSEEQSLLRTSIEKFLAAKYDARRRNAEAVRTGLDRAIWSEMADLGLLGLPFEEDLGGAEGSALDVLLVCESFGRSLVVEPYISAVVLAGGALRHGATAAQRAELIPPIIAGEKLYALAFAEPQSRFNLSHVETEARKGEGGYVLAGRKSVVYGAPSADALLVVARERQRSFQGQGGCVLVGDVHVHQPVLDDLELAQRLPEGDAGAAVLGGLLGQRLHGGHHVGAAGGRGVVDRPRDGGERCILRADQGRRWKTHAGERHLAGSKAVDGRIVAQAQAWGVLRGQEQREAGLIAPRA